MLHNGFKQPLVSAQQKNPRLCRLYTSLIQRYRNRKADAPAQLPAANLIVNPNNLPRGIMVLSVVERTFNQEVLESSIPVLVNFWAPWCGLCQNIQPLLLQFQAHCNDQIKLVGINADENFKLSNTYRLTTLPTLILIEDGKVVNRLDSFRGRDDLGLALEKIRSSYLEYKTYSGVLVGPHAVDWECRSA